MVTSTKTEATEETIDCASTVLVQPVACYRRCKLCKQAHDDGKCDALLRSKVDKKDLTPELQSSVFGNHLN
ncbi:LOW QUALITY PROTEIN: Hypothetical protein PHPALM_11169 [Phytophthora palmivora]|uniref:Uncharacterized protein n=1 Tax=Phytophthora palmivora TaxID=4796 RepID=A0A2P4Y2X3_9STRA|nr:LOW QUALITY PROTEIN: Hypothetical protein PHPALM_11169 [Phytophthora palmivora]